MTPAPPALRHPDLSGLRVLVVGLGRSGLAAARLAAAHGARVRVADRRRAAELDGDLVGRLQRLDAELVAGGHSPELARDAELIVVSPGVSREQPLFRAAADAEVPVWGEVELAARFCRGRVLGVTGTNGKSTVTAMCGAILRGAGIPGGTGGNLDTPFSELLDLDGDDAVHAVELSSFQLETVEALRPAVAVIVNLSPDHLDRYRSFDEYAAAKRRLLEVQDRRGAAVLNADDPESVRFVPAVRGALYRVSTRSEPAAGAFVRDGVLTLRGDAGEEPVLARGELPVAGEHNLVNALAAAIACRLAGCDTAKIAAGLQGYRPLPHRLQRVAVVRGVEFWDDSKATNPDAALCALESFPAGRVLQILGGRDKGTRWAPLAPRFARARCALLVGEAAGDLRRALAGIVETVDCGTVAEAVRAALDSAVAGDVVLLAPACASFDQYRNFAERGDDFRHVVERLESENLGA